MASKEIKVILRDDLELELKNRVKSGEFKSINEVLEVALKYYFERHSPEEMAKYVDEEVRTGLDGSA